MTMIKLRNAVLAVFVVLIGLAALQARGDGGDGDDTKRDTDDKIKVVLKIFVKVPSGYATPYARGDVRGSAGKHSIDWPDSKMPPFPAAVRAAFDVNHGDFLQAGVVVRSGAVEAVSCRWYLDDARHQFEGTDITTEKIDTMNGISALCKGSAP